MGYLDTTCNDAAESFKMNKTGFAANAGETMTVEKAVG